MTNPGTPHHPGFREVPWNGKASVETGPTRLSTSRPQPGGPVPYNASSNKLQSEKVTLDSKGIWANRYEAKAFAYALPPVNAEGTPTGAVPALLVNLKTGEQIILTPGAGFRFDNEFQVKSVESSLGAADAGAVLWVSFGDVVPVSTFVPEAVSVTVTPSPSEGVDIDTGTAEEMGVALVGAAHGEGLITAGLNEYANAAFTTAGGTLVFDPRTAKARARVVFSVSGPEGANITALTGRGYVTLGLNGATSITNVYDANGYLVSQIGRIRLANLGAGAQGVYAFYVDMAGENPLVCAVPSYTDAGGAVTVAVHIDGAPMDGPLQLVKYPAPLSLSINNDQAVPLMLAAAAGQEVWVMSMDVSSNVPTADYVEIQDTAGANLWAAYSTGAPFTRSGGNVPLFISPDSLNLVTAGVNLYASNLTYGLVTI